MADLTRDTLPPPEQRRPLVPAEVPALGGTLYVRRLSAGQVLRLPDDPAQFTGQIVLQSAHYADGARVWQDDQLETVLAYPAEDLKPLVEKALEVNGIGPKALEERQGN